MTSPSTARRAAGDGETRTQLEATSGADAADGAVPSAEADGAPAGAGPDGAGQLVASPPEALERAAALVAPALEAAVARLCPELAPVVEHHMQAGGKRVRAALAVLSAEAVGAPPEEALVGAVAVELVHNFSLIHDDVVDGDTERRHRRTVWIEFGLGPAVVAGDALAALATELLLEDPTPPRVRAALCLTRATAAMIAGQAQDMAFERRQQVSVEDCRAMEAAKTGALLACASSIGAILAGAADPVVEALADYGNHLGMSFQAVDDVLGIWGRPEVTGKPVGSDLLAHKKTLPIVLAMDGLPAGLLRRVSALLAGDLSAGGVAAVFELLEHQGACAAALDFALEHREQALAALRRVPLVEGPAAELAAVARYVTERDR